MHDVSSAMKLAIEIEVRTHEPSFKFEDINHVEMATSVAVVEEAAFTH